MPAAIVLVKQQPQQQQQIQQHQRRKQNFNINICAPLRSCDVDADAAAATTNISNAADVGVAAARATEWRTRTQRQQQRSAKAASTSRTVIIIMALVFSIMQQQQQQQQVLQWPFYNGVYAAEATHYNNNNNNINDNISNNNSYNNNNNNISRNDLNANDMPPVSSSVARTLPQTDATNNTFKSLAFLASDRDSFGSSSTMDGYAFGLPDMEMGMEMETETKLAQSLPIFDFGMPRNITGRTGHTEAIIKCRVDSLLDKSVSWIRKRDLHILTVGTATYTSDKRFQVTESKDTREWTLHVKSPLAKDSGIYECQVNTEPKMSMAFQLNIIEISPDAKAIISGPHDLYFKAGSAIILSCVVKQPSIKDIGPIYWYRGENMITPFDADDGENEASSEALQPRQLDQGAKQVDQSLNEVLSNDLQKDFAIRIAMESQLGDTLKSRLRISNAQTTDTGNYTCQPTTASSASVLVHVINDENPAAMQKSAALALFGQQQLGLMLCSVLLLQWAKY